MKYIVVTGCCGMIGSKLTKKMLESGFDVLGIDRRISDVQEMFQNYKYINIDILETNMLETVFTENDIVAVIHLAALAHNNGCKKITWEEYYKTNVVCSENVFRAALKRNIPVLYISTADVYGITEGVVDTKTECAPISNYARSKYMAEQKLKELSEEYHSEATIMRLAPVYTDAIKRDIQKRYYLKYPHVAYRIGKGKEYEFLSVDNAVEAFLEWIEGYKSYNRDGFKIYNIKDEQRVNTVDMLKTERELGRAKLVLIIPKLFVELIYKTLKTIAPNNKFVYLVHKAVNPIKTNKE